MAAGSDTLSVDTSFDHHDDPLVDMTDEQILELLTETIRSNEVLETETKMFDKFFNRLDAKDLQPNTTSLAQQGGGGATSSHHSGSQSSLNEVGAPGGMTSRVGRKRSRSRASNADRTIKLTFEQKCEIALKETEELQEDASRLTDDSERVLDTHKAVMEEADIRMAEMRKAYYEFERDIVKGAVNHRTNKVIAEKITRYFEDKIRSRDTLVEKLRLKNSTLKVQKKKLQLQLRQKEELGEVLHEVDFNQLKIENQQYIEKIDERNQDLLKLKLMAGNTLQVLNSYKKKLHSLTVESERLKSEISSREEMHTRIDSETTSVETERAKAEKINKKLRQQLSDFRVPDVLDYVAVKADLYELNKKVKSWDRKVEIADMALKINRKAWRQMRRVNSEDNMVVYNGY